MELQNVKVHSRCFCYDSQNSVALLRELNSGETGSDNLYESEVLFLLKGSVHISLDERYERTLVKDEFVFMPAGVLFSYKAEEDSTMLSIRIESTETPECNIFQLNKIPQRIENPYEGIYALKLNDRMQTFISGFLDTLSDGLKCHHYIKMGASQMLYLLHAYYPLDEHIKFFSQVVSPDVRFSEFVRTNWHKYNTVDELAGALFMTSQRFSSRFRKIFGTTPRDWMIRQKARKIYQDICRSGISLKEIAIKYNFSSESNFFRFCKQIFGESPGRIRNNLRNDLPPL